MKKLISALLAACAVLSAGAQSTKVVTGAVIDKNGNPLPSALVEATNGAESVTTDADGTFSIEVPVWLKSLTASYAGLQSKKANIRDRNNVVFELSKKEPKWFVNFVCGVSNDIEDEIQCARFGVMGGSIGKWGYYAKVLVPVDMKDEYDDSYYFPTITAGVIKQVASIPVYFYLGGGVTATYEKWNYGGKYEYDERVNFLGELGFFYRIKHLTLGCGYGIAPFDNIQHNVNFSIGYCF